MTQGTLLSFFYGSDRICIFNRSSCFYVWSSFLTVEFVSVSRRTGKETYYKQNFLYSSEGGSGTRGRRSKVKYDEVGGVTRGVNGTSTETIE